MGKTSKSRDNIPVAGPALDAAVHISAPFRCCLLPERIEQNDTPVLLFDIFGMMERVVKPNPGDGGERGIKLSFDGPVDNFESTSVAPIGPRRIAVRVSRELVEQQDQRQRTVGRGLPCHKFTRAGSWDEVAETGAYVVVDERASLIPPVAAVRRRFGAVQAGAEPKGDNFRYGFDVQS